MWRIVPLCIVRASLLMSNLVVRQSKLVMKRHFDYIFPSALSFGYPCDRCGVKQRKDREAVIHSAQTRRGWFPLVSFLLLFLIRMRVMCSPRATHFWFPKRITQTSGKGTEGSRRHGEERWSLFYLSACHLSSPVLITVGTVDVPPPSLFFLPPPLFGSSSPLMEKKNR